MQPSSKTFRSLAISFVILLGLLGATQSLQAQETPENDQSAADIVNAAWEKAVASGTYAYQADLKQTVIPAPSLINAGRQPQVTKMLLEGSIDQAADTMEMTVWNDSSGDPNKGIGIRIENGQTFGRLGQGEWEEVDNIADGFAPGGDPLGFLAGATNIQAAGSESRQYGDVELTLTRYTFDLDGHAFGEHMRLQSVEAMQKYGPIPPNVKLDVPD
jgi:hypothetical protein